MNRPLCIYPSGRRGNNSRPHTKIATTSPSQGVALQARHSLPGRTRGNFCVGATIVGKIVADCCHGDRLGTQVVGSTSEHDNKKTHDDNKKLLQSAQHSHASQPGSQGGEQSDCEHVPYFLKQADLILEDVVFMIWVFGLFFFNGPKRPSRTTGSYPEH